MKIENDLGNDRISGLVWKIAIPSMLAQFVSVCYSIVAVSYTHLPLVGMERHLSLQHPAVLREAVDFISHRAELAVGHGAVFFQIVPFPFGFLPGGFQMCIRDSTRSFRYTCSMLVMGMISVPPLVSLMRNALLRPNRPTPNSR